MGSGNSFLYGIDTYIYDLTISNMGWVGLGWVGSENSVLYGIHIYICDLSISNMGWVELGREIHFYME